MTYGVHMATPLTPLAEVVTMALSEAGLSEVTAAEAAGIPRSTLKRNLKDGAFTHANMWKIATVLGTTPSRLLTAAEERAA